jgi:hypothetical protein
VLLARIDKFSCDKPIEPSAIRNEVRRRVGTYQPTVITGINWVHGAVYLPRYAEQILGTEAAGGGIELHFSRPIHVSCLQRGVVEMWRIEGGGGRSGYISEIRGEFVVEPGKAMVTMLRYRQIDQENLDHGDRILILVRCAFILDHCCRSVDGAHMGGRVPAIPGTIRPEQIPPSNDCNVPPWGYAPWTSGNGSPGSNFESWIIVSDKG